MGLIFVLSQMLSGLGRFVANKVFKFPRGTNLSSYTQLYTAFFLSATFHFAGEFTYERRFVYRSFKFFLLQAVAITFEDFIIYAVKRTLLWMGIERDPGDGGGYRVGVVVRTVGYIWVVMWFCWTLPIYIDEASVAGFYQRDRKPIAQYLFNSWKRWA